MNLILLACLLFLQTNAYMGVGSTGQPTYTYTLQRVQSLLHQEDITAISGFAYYAHAHKAYNNNHKQKNMGNLFFNQSNFTPAQTGLVPKSLFSNSIISPNVTYKEWGGLVTAWSKKYITNKTVIGARLDIPIKKVTVTNKVCKKYYQLARATRVIQQNVNTLLENPQAPDSTGKVAHDTELVGMSTINTNAYRLDLLTDLNYGFTPPQSSYPIVDYHDTTFVPTAPITIYNQDVTNGDNNPVSTLNQAVGTVPHAPYAVSYTKTQELPVLPANGSSQLDQRARFSDSVNYTPLGLDTSAQETLWIMPTLVPDPEPKDLAELAAYDICLESQSRSGLGNIVTDFFTGYHISDKFYAEGIFGISWPTGHKRNPSKVFQPILGNNGHFELRLETQGLYDFCRWFAFRADCSYNWVLNKNERLAEQLAQATVTNIGPILDTDVSWQYGRVELDTIFTLPNQTSYLYLGYGFYGKRKVHSSGHIPKLSACGHTLHGALFYDYKFMELSLSAEHTVAGKNIPKNSLGSLGLTFYF